MHNFVHNAFDYVMHSIEKETKREKKRDEERANKKELKMQKLKSTFCLFD